MACCNGFFKLSTKQKCCEKLNYPHSEKCEKNVDK